MEKNIKTRRIHTVEDVRGAPERIASFSDGMGDLNEELKRFLMKRLYRHYRVVRMSGKAERIVKDLFSTYLSIPEQLPPAIYEEYNRTKSKRVVTDYIAQMTDKFAIDEHGKLFSPYEKV